mgnify:CR=1 FL=1
MLNFIDISYKCHYVNTEFDRTCGKRDPSQELWLQPLELLP